MPPSRANEIARLRAVLKRIAENCCAAR